LIALHLIAIFHLLPEIWQKEGVVVLGFRPPLGKRGFAPLLSYSIVLSTSSPFSVKGVPQSRVHKSLTSEYLLVVSWAILILLAVHTKELLKILPVKVAGSLAR
jgi:hypothetical protein